MKVSHINEFSYFVSAGLGSLLKSRGISLERSLFEDTQLDTGGPALSSSSSAQTSIFFYEGSLTGETLTVSSQHKNKQSYLSLISLLFSLTSILTVLSSAVRRENGDSET